MMSSQQPGKEAEIWIQVDADEDSNESDSGHSLEPYDTSKGSGKRGIGTPNRRGEPANDEPADSERRAKNAKYNDEPQGGSEQNAGCMLFFNQICYQIL